MLKKQYQPIETNGGKMDYPLSHQQERIWYLSQITPENTYWNRFSCYRLKGFLDYERLENAMSMLIQRHQILNLTIVETQHGPRQRQLSTNKPPISLVDLSDIPLPSREERFRENLMDLNRVPIRLYHDRLFEMIIYRFDSRDHRLLFKFHHIFSDATSFQVLWRDLVRLYNQKTTLGPAILIQYSDYAIWQREMFLEQNTKIDEAYWLKKFEGALPVLSLPNDSQVLTNRGFAGAAVTVFLDKSQLKLLERFSFRNKVLPYSTFLAVFFLFLRKYSQNNNIIVGTVFAGRHYHPELKRMAGFFVNTVAIREDVNLEISFKNFVSQIQLSVNEAHFHQDYPFERLIQKINPIRGNNRYPLFNVVFNYLSQKGEDELFEGIETSESVPIPVTSSQADIALEIRTRTDGAEICFEYDSELFLPETVQRMLAHYSNLLVEVLETPDKQLFQYSPLEEMEYHKWLENSCGIIKEYPEDVLIHELFETKAQEMPMATALKCRDITLSYDELNCRANRLARFLRRSLVKPGDLVAICLDRSIEMIEGMLSIIKAGGAYVPIDPKFPQERINTILRDSGAVVLLSKETFKEKFSNIFIPKILLDKDCKAWNREKSDNLSREVGSQDRAYVIYTSGSTGKPKGVVIIHRTVVNLIDWVNKTFQVNESDCLLFTTSYCFDLSVYDIFGILAAGGMIRIATESELEDPNTLARIIIHESISFWDSAPARLQQLIPFFSDQDISHTLRLVFLSGDWIPLNLPGQLKKHFQMTKVIGLGGATEATIWSNWFEIGDIDPSWRSIPYGKPIQNSRYYVLDEYLQPCPMGVPGDLYIAGDCLFLEYLNDPVKTKERLLPDPFFVNDCKSLMYQTGDIVRFLADGNMELIGRKDFQVKIRGYRVELGEIESVLASYKDVDFALVTAHTDQTGNKRLIAYVRMENNDELIEEQLKGYLSIYLPEYMIPAHIVVLNSLPLTSNGKVDRKSLPVPEIQDQSKSKRIAPRTLIEKVLYQVWLELLRVDSVDINDSFFALGGHSLLATQAVIRIREHFKVDIPMAKILDYPSIAELAPYIEKIRNLNKSFEYTSIALSDEREVGKI